MSLCFCSVLTINIFVILLNNNLFYKNLTIKSMTMFDRVRTPFWRGVRAAALYYGVATLVFILLKVVLPLRHDVYLYFLFIPVVLLAGFFWAVVSLIASFFRVWPRGALIVHVIVILLTLLVCFPQTTCFPHSHDKSSQG